MAKKIGKYFTRNKLAAVAFGSIALSLFGIGSGSAYLTYIGGGALIGAAVLYWQGKKRF